MRALNFVFAITNTPEACSPLILCIEEETIFESGLELIEIIKSINCDSIITFSPFLKLIRF